MRAWRIATGEFAGSGAQIVDGAGAREFGGRWNAPGRPVVYAASSLSLAALEVLVHIDPNRMPPYRYAALDIPDELLRRIPWPADGDCVRAGEALLDDDGFLGFVIPSAVVPEESTVVLARDHPAFEQVVVSEPQPFVWDQRLVALIHSGK